MFKSRHFFLAIFSNPGVMWVATNSCWFLQWQPEKIGRRLYDFKKNNMHEKQPLCSVNRPISLNLWSNKWQVKLLHCNSIKYTLFLKVVFLYQSFLVYTAVNWSKWKLLKILVLETRKLPQIFPHQVGGSEELLLNVVFLLYPSWK